MDIEKCRSDFIREIIKNNGGRKILEHVGEIDPMDIPADKMESYKKLQTGDERNIEFHIFRFIKSDIMMINQWRLRCYKAPKESNTHITFVRNL